MSNFLISLFFSFGLIDYVLRIWWSCLHLKKDIAYISMMGHFCTDMKVSSLHNLMKKQWLIPVNSTLFCYDWICIWMTFWIYIVSINVVKQSNYFLIFILSVITLMKFFLVIILCFPPSVKIITYCLISNFWISLFFSFGLIDYVLRILWSCQH